VAPGAATGAAREYATAATAAALAAGKVLRFTLPSGKEMALPLDKADSPGVYATLCTALRAQLNPAAEAFSLPKWTDPAAEQAVCEWLKRAWLAL